MIERRDFLKAIGGLSASALLSSMASCAAGTIASLPRKKPNYLVIVADDQCYRTIHALNNDEVYTPNFDRMVARGTTFTHCFHQGSWTGAICIASRAMMHTARFIWRCGGNSCGYYPLLGEAMQMGGYDTYAVGKWHNGDESALRSFTQGKTIGPGFFASTPANGLAYNRPRSGDPWTAWDPKYRGHWTPYDLWDIECQPTKDLYENGPGCEKAGARYEVHKYSAELYADSAIEFLQKTAAQPDNPFFLYVAWNSPHDPRQAPKEYLDMYPPDRIEVPPNFLPQHPFNQGDFLCRDEKLAPFPRTREAVQLHRSEYYALISYMDYQMGRILDALEKTGQAGNTYIIVTGDHGLSVGEHGILGKGDLYDCSVRMPFIIAGPEIAAAKKIDSMVYQHCLFPTMCELASIATPATVQFPSLLPLLRGARGQLFDSIYCAYRGFQRMARTEKYKLILYPEAKQIQLFDMENDPLEMNNVASRHPEKVSELFRELKEWQQTVGDAMVLDPAMFSIKV